MGVIEHTYYCKGCNFPVEYKYVLGDASFRYHKKARHTYCPRTNVTHMRNVLCGPVERIIKRK